MVVGQDRGSMEIMAEHFVYSDLGRQKRGENPMHNCIQTKCLSFLVVLAWLTSVWRRKDATTQ